MKPRKYLYENGTVSQKRKIQVVCLFDGHPCGFVSHTGKYFNSVCSGQVSEEIEFIDDNAALGEAVIDLGNGRNASSYCCQNSSHSIRFYGNQCLNVSNHIKDICTVLEQYKSWQTSLLCIVGKVCLFVELHQEGSATNGATPSI